MKNSRMSIMFQIGLGIKNKHFQTASNELKFSKLNIDERQRAKDLLKCLYNTI